MLSSDDNGHTTCTCQVYVMCMYTHSNIRLVAAVLGTVTCSNARLFTFQLLLAYYAALLPVPCHYHVLVCTIRRQCYV